jgi:hypothetical protein
MRGAASPIGRRLQDVLSFGALGAAPSTVASRPEDESVRTGGAESAGLLFLDATIAFAISRSRTTTARIFGVPVGLEDYIRSSRRRRPR